MAIDPTQRADLSGGAALAAAGADAEALTGIASRICSSAELGLLDGPISPMPGAAFIAELDHLDAVVSVTALAALDPELLEYEIRSQQIAFYHELDACASLDQMRTLISAKLAGDPKNAVEAGVRALVATISADLELISTFDATIEEIVTPDIILNTFKAKYHPDSNKRKEYLISILVYPYPDILKEVFLEKIGYNRTEIAHLVVLNNIINMEPDIPYQLGILENLVNHLRLPHDLIVEIFDRYELELQFQQVKEKKLRFAEYTPCEAIVLMPWKNPTEINAISSVLHIPAKENLFEAVIIGLITAKEEEKPELLAQLDTIFVTLNSDEADLRAEMEAILPKMKKEGFDFRLFSEPAQSRIASKLLWWTTRSTDPTVEVPATVDGAVAFDAAAFASSAKPASGRLKRPKAYDPTVPGLYVILPKSKDINVFRKTAAGLSVSRKITTPIQPANITPDLFAVLGCHIFAAMIEKISQ